MDVYHEAVLRHELRDFAEAYELSVREQEIIHCLLHGYTASDSISARLGISPNTTNNHVKNILDKTRCSSKTDLLSLVFKHLIERYANLQLFAKKPRILLVGDGTDAEAQIVERLATALCGFGVDARWNAGPDDVKSDFHAWTPDFLISGGEATAENLVKKIHSSGGQVPTLFILKSDSEAEAVEGVAFEKSVDAETVFFAILEHYVDNPWHKRRLLRVETDLVATTDSGVQVKIQNLGVGGAFLPLGQDTFRWNLKIKVGDRIRFSFALPTVNESIDVTAEVIWKRGKARYGMPAGMGVMFHNLTEKNRTVIHDFIRRQKLRAYLPQGSTIRYH